MAERQAERKPSAPYDKLLRAGEMPAFGGSLFPPFGIPLGSFVCEKLQKPISAGNCVRIRGKPS
ncbi:hypothetical protein [Treponema endosymbiont of Eucomonympha sp.]|uniref:hypothetical protein n=1 Tax=Treponema endosymbiont of Eucomonympha sp. TaxID=1580831 RepID=UPI0007826900|nr:hypothetical protein [Treponema endosymbiont of Eucomonympha sp.]